MLGTSMITGASSRNIQGLINLRVQVLERGCVELERGCFHAGKALEGSFGGGDLEKNLKRERLCLKHD
jgi:hypothetical protein